MDDFLMPMHNQIGQKKNETFFENGAFISVMGSWMKMKDVRIEALPNRTP